MIITIDTALKTIEVKESYNLGMLVSQLAEMFPDGEWKNYTIKSLYDTIDKYPGSNMPFYTPPYSPTYTSPTVISSP